MAKAKTLKGRKKSSKKLLKQFKFNDRTFLDRKHIAEVLADALIANDIDSFRDVLIAHLATISKTELAKSTGIGRQTIYDLIESDNFDPRISTLGALLSKISA